MAQLKSRIETALNESRILVLGTQVLVGAQFFAVFESSFPKLPPASQLLTVGVLGPLLLALALFMSPAPFHQIAERGVTTERFEAYIGRVISLALLPFAVCLALDLYIVTEKVSGTGPGLLAGGVTAAVALFFWYALELRDRAGHRHGPGSTGHDGDPGAHGGQAPGGQQGGEQSGEQSRSSVEDRVRNVLTETRVVLPGVQALMGFQFDTILTDAFDKLPGSSKYLHLGSLGLMTFSMILLMAPAAYHRLVERGDDTEHFQRFASRLVLAAMVPLALGIVVDMYVITLKVTESPAVAVLAAGVLLLLFGGLWFGFTLWRRAQEPARPA